EKITVTGSVKYDGVVTDRDNAKTAAFRELFGIRNHETVWVAGSTQAPEEETVLDVYQRLKLMHPNLRLILVPRQKDRFDEVAGIPQRNSVAFVRRSALNSMENGDDLLTSSPPNSGGEGWGEGGRGRGQFKAPAHPAFGHALPPVAAATLGEKAKTDLDAKT